MEALQPIFITLEEVHGVIIHQFPKEGLQVWQEASRQKARRERRQRRQQQQQGSSQAPAGASSLFGGSSTQQAAASAAAGDGGEEDGGDEEESVEGEEEEGEDEEEAAAAETEEALRAAGDGDEETPNGSKVFRPFLLLVPQLLALGYQVRMWMGVGDSRQAVDAVCMCRQVLQQVLRRRKHQAMCVHCSQDEIFC